MSIVCATHFSNTSFDAVKAAAALASVHHERLCLISVLPTSPVETLNDQLLGDALRLHVDALSADGLEAEMEVLHGTLEASVRRYCEAHAASLLVVGDSSAPTSFLLNRPLHVFKDGVDVPLLVVRDPRPFEAWVGGTIALKVLLALDHTLNSSVARDWITQLAKYGPIELVAAFVWWPQTEDRRQGTTSSPEDDHAAMQEKLRAELSAALEPLPDNVRWRVHLEVGAEHIAETLLTLANVEQVDLFVLGSHPVTGPIARLRGRSSVSSGVLDDAPMSVACIPSRPLPTAP
jgi:nucleotide-binding universal stress UspA family protein